MVECPYCEGKGKIDTGNLSLGEYLGLIRNTRGYTLRTVEEQTGITNAYISQIETGKAKEIGFSKLIKLAEFYGLKIEDLAEFIKKESGHDK